MSIKNRIAIIEDDTFMAELIKQMIDVPAVDAEIFLLANDFLRCPDAEKFSTIILDMTLPDIDVFDLLEMLSNNSRDWRILLISGHEASVITAASLYAKGLGIHVIGTLHKPFSQAELLTMMGIA